MSKLAQTTSKYTIYAHFEAEGTVEKPDVIGAVFGQTEGLLGMEMDLRELQRTGRIGRIDVDLKTLNGKTSGVIIIPSSLDSSETALLAATMETIERVGPCNARILVEKIEDVRIAKRKYVIERAKELLEKMSDQGIPEIQEITEQLKESVRVSEVTYHNGLPAGPNLETYDSLIIVEGRADVVNLLRCGIRNVIAIEGTSVPQTIIDLSREKTTTLFLDGDRGGDLILKEIFAVCDVDFVARAPRGKEVEDLSKKEVFKSLRERIPSDQLKGESAQEKTEYKEYETKKIYRKQTIDPEKAAKFKEALFNLTGSKAAYYFTEEMEPIGKVPIKEIFNTIRESNADVLVLDGSIDRKLVELCMRNKIKYLIGIRAEKFTVPENIKVVTLEDLE